MDYLKQLLHITILLLWLLRTSSSSILENFLFQLFPSLNVLDITIFDFHLYRQKAMKRFATAAVIITTTSLLVTLVISENMKLILFSCGKLFWFSFITARKRTLGQGDVFTGVCLSTGGEESAYREFCLRGVCLQGGLRIVLKCFLVLIQILLP